MTKATGIPPRLWKATWIHNEMREETLSVCSKTYNASTIILIWVALVVLSLPCVAVTLILWCWCCNPGVSLANKATHAYFHTIDREHAICRVKAISFGSTKTRQIYHIAVLSSNMYWKVISSKVWKKNRNFAPRDYSNLCERGWSWVEFRDVRFLVIRLKTELTT